MVVPDEEEWEKEMTILMFCLGVVNVVALFAAARIEHGLVRNLAFAGCQVLVIATAITAVWVGANAPRQAGAFGISGVSPEGEAFVIGMVFAALACAIAPRMWRR